MYTYNCMCVYIYIYIYIFVYLFHIKSMLSAHQLFYFLSFALFLPCGRTIPLKWSGKFVTVTELG